jgi:hypothetical protein
VARRRNPAKKKDDAEDARIACRIALDRHEQLRPLIPHGEIAAELRSIARDDDRAAKDEQRLLNRLRADLIATFPQALVISKGDLGAPTFLRFLQRWPTARALQGVSRTRLATFARSCFHGWPDRFANQVKEALASEQFKPKEEMVRAKADGIVLVVTQLLAIGAQRRAWERRMGELLLGGPRQGRDRIAPEEKEGQAFPAAESTSASPGSGTG